MNTWQNLQQIRYLIRNQNWTGSSTPVFHEEAVIVSAAPQEEVAEKVIMPIAILAPGAATVDDEAADLVEQEVIIKLGVSSSGDAYGESALIGSHRASQTDSQGRGLLEVEEELFNAVELLNTDDGVVIQHRASSAVRPEYVAGQYLLFRDYLYKLDCTADRYYHPVSNLQES